MMSASLNPVFICPNWAVLRAEVQTTTGQNLTETITQEIMNETSPSTMSAMFWRFNSLNP